MIKFGVLALLIALASGHKENYRNYKVFRISPTTFEQNALLHKLSELSDGYSFWNGPTIVNTTSDLMVSPEKINEFENLMKISQTNYSVHIDDVEELIENENPSVKSKSKLTSDGFDWKSYHTLEEIYAWLYLLADKYPNNVQVIVAGKTYEGRNITGIKISFKNGNPGIFIESNIHAREWITSATSTYLINELLTSQNSDIRELAEKNDWYIFPVFNPDGFVYTHTKQRLWRKTRKPYGLFCRGSDPNRNWGYKWMEGGASSMPCSETYAGTGPFSDIETLSMSKYIKSISDKFYAYVSFHSYSQLLLFPYGHTEDHLDNYDQLLAIGKKTISALSTRYGTSYVTGNIAETIYVASGGSMDWVKAEFKTPITYTYELRDKGRYGFILPANQIIPTGEETVDSLVAMFKEAKAYGIPERQ
ncbi:hypothetical protein HCN44_001024 [Aphidius gifuensis]|uniref:Zinc carboxypeptidase A 1 n=1 Tax=Aphidius gifuensis TaxID=684658 RepID=A0A834XKN0_APHGI|nr:zinc carboxypeptidase-like [Aphidius gifuensis]KAF7988451.1 hypothetical protein HCN44_001024 [Aphidius gifuensis]